MTIRFEPGVEDALRAHAREGYPDEVCGLLVGIFDGTDVRVVRVRRAPNGAGRDRASSFHIHPRDIMAAEDELDSTGLEIVGFYHSHPDVPASPSPADQAAAWPGYVHAIVSVLSGEARHVSVWRAVAGRLQEQTLVRA